MKIMLGGGEVLVTQDARDDADVNMQIHQMRGTGMTAHVHNLSKSNGK